MNLTRERFCVFHCATVAEATCRSQMGPQGEGLGFLFAARSQMPCVKLDSELTRRTSHSAWFLLCRF